MSIRSKICAYLAECFEVHKTEEDIRKKEAADRLRKAIKEYNDALSCAEKEGITGWVYLKDYKYSFSVGSLRSLADSEITKVDLEIRKKEEL